MARKKPGPKPHPSRVRDKVTIVRSMPAWHEWAAGLAAHDGTDLSKLIERALAAYARQRGYPEEPPPR